MIRAGLKLRNLKVKTFEETDIATLETSINDWLVARGEEDLVAIRIEAAAASQYDAFILYTEE